MRRISLVLALIGAAAGCGKSAVSKSGGNKGVAEGTFNVTVQNGQNGNTSLAITRGYVKSIPAGIDCGVAPHGACSADFPASATVTLTAYPDTSTNPPSVVLLWAGDCSGMGTTCSLAGAADRYVLIELGTEAERTAHPNFTDPAVHAPAFKNETLDCKRCHGASYAGMGIAPACRSCHDGLVHGGQNSGLPIEDFAVTHASAALSATPICDTCHILKNTQWASASDLHAAPAVDILTNVDHNTNEQLVDECIQCHSMFQRPLGIAALVTPVDQVGSPAGTWTLLPAASQWQATRCEVCHDATSSAEDKLAKYGAVLDDPFVAGYVDWSAAAAAASPDRTWLTAPYEWVFDGTSAYVQTPIAPTSSNALGIAATRLCSSCHDPDDQGGDPNVVVGSADFGAQGGDSRAFVTASHAQMACIDCHPTHDFTPVDPAVAPGCATSGCHDVDRTGTIPGVVHANHIP